MLSVQPVKLMSQPAFGQRRIGFEGDSPRSDTELFLEETITNLEELKGKTPKETHGFLNFMIKLGKAAVAGVGVYLVANKSGKAIGEFTKKTYDKIPDKYKNINIVPKVKDLLNKTKFGQKSLTKLDKIAEKFSTKFPKVPKFNADKVNNTVAVVMGTGTGISTLILPDKSVLDKEVKNA